MICTGARNWNGVRSAINAGSNPNVYGSNGGMIGKFNAINSEGTENLDMSAYDAGLRINKGKGGNFKNKFWSGCTADGKASENNCNDFSSNAKGLKATWG